MYPGPDIADIATTNLVGIINIELPIKYIGYIQLPNRRPLVGMGPCCLQINPISAIKRLILKGLISISLIQHRLGGTATG